MHVTRGEIKPFIYHALWCFFIEFFDWCVRKGERKFADYKMPVVCFIIELNAHWKALEYKVFWGML